MRELLSVCEKSSGFGAASVVDLSEPGLMASRR